MIKRRTQLEHYLCDEINDPNDSNTVGLSRTQVDSQLKPTRKTGFLVKKLLKHGLQHASILEGCDARSIVTGNFRATYQKYVCKSCVEATCRSL